MKKYILATALFTAFGLAYIERAPAIAEEKVAPTRWGCGQGQKRCVWDSPETYASYKSAKRGSVQVAGYRWACHKKCYWT